MAAYHYTLRGLSRHGSVSLSGTVATGKEVTLEELIRKIGETAGEELDPALSGAILMVDGKRVDWDNQRGLVLSDGSRVTWIAPALGG
ncbi:MAG: hypothetical protein K6T66_10095 [Peptococcaceae bacterium]|nr:hypothetical protein [Peptococcaceae bacterium]